MARTRSIAVAPAAALLVLSACTSGGATGDPAAEGPSPPEDRWQEIATNPAWALDGYTPVSRVRSIGDDGFALYALNADAELEAIVVDAASGEVRWHHPANPSWIVAGVGLSIEADEELVVFLTGAGGGAEERGVVHIAGADADSGEVRWLQRSLETVTTHPSFCDDSEKVCVIGRQGSVRLFAVLGRDGEVQALTAVDDGRIVSGNLFPTDDSSALKRLDFDGEEQWRRPTTELFGGAEVSPDNGWHFRNQDGRYVGQLGIDWREESDDVFRMPLGDRVLAAFDEQTGEPLWSQVGTFVCGGIAFTLDHPVRCRSDGQWVFEHEEQSLDGEVTVEGYDPASGETVWSWEAGHAPGLIFSHESVRRLDTTTYLVTTDEGQVILDIATGDRQVSEEPLPSWCSERRDYSPALKMEGKHTNDLVVTEWWPCHADGTALEQPMTVPEFAGARAGDVFAWVYDGQLHAVTAEEAAD